MFRLFGSFGLEAFGMLRIFARDHEKSRRFPSTSGKILSDSPADSVGVSPVRRLRKLERFVLRRFVRAPKADRYLLGRSFRKICCKNCNFGHFDVQSVENLQRQSHGFRSSALTRVKILDSGSPRKLGGIGEKPKNFQKISIYAPGISPCHKARVDPISVDPKALGSVLMERIQICIQQ